MNDQNESLNYERQTTNRYTPMNDISRQLRSAKREVKILLDDNTSLKQELACLREHLGRIKKGKAAMRRSSSPPSSPPSAQHESAKEKAPSEAPLSEAPPSEAHASQTTGLTASEKEHFMAIRDLPKEHRVVLVSGVYDSMKSVYFQISSKTSIGKILRAYGKYNGIPAEDLKVERIDGEDDEIHKTKAVDALDLCMLVKHKNKNMN